MDPTLKTWRTEAAELRASVEVSDVTASLDTLHAQLVASRRAQDRLEAILADAGLVRARLRKLVSELEGVYEDKWRDAMNATRIGEYASAKEKDATYATQALQELVNVRRAKRMLADAEEVYDYVQVKHRGMDSARRDIDSRIRMISLAAQLER